MEEKSVSQNTKTISSATRRRNSFIFGGIALAVVILIGVWIWNSQDVNAPFILCVIGAIIVFTLVSCLILANNFIGEMLLEIFSWGFVKFPELIFMLDLDGIIWLLTVKLLFWILGIILAIGAGLLAIALSGLMSIFVYPFALAKSFKEY